VTIQKRSVHFTPRTSPDSECPRHPARTSGGDATHAHLRPRHPRTSDPWRCRTPCSPVIAPFQAMTCLNRRSNAASARSRIVRIGHVGHHDVRRGCCHRPRGQSWRSGSRTRLASCSANSTRSTSLLRGTTMSSFSLIRPVLRSAVAELAAQLPEAFAGLLAHRGLDTHGCRNPRPRFAAS